MRKGRAIFMYRQLLVGELSRYPPTMYRQLSVGAEELIRQLKVGVTWLAGCNRPRQNIHSPDVLRSIGESNERFRRFYAHFLG